MIKYLNYFLLREKIRNDFNIFDSLKDERFTLRWKDKHLCTKDNTKETKFDRHYVYHTAWAARILSKLKPAKHVDISSDMRFTTLVSAFIPTEFYDHRPPLIKLPGMNTKKVNITRLPFENNSVLSLSCMHVVEHIGLGRYGDKVDPQGDLKAIDELSRVLAIGGNLLFVVPVGKEAKIMFNAHRIYTNEQILSTFNLKGLLLKEITLIPELEEDGNLVINPTPELLKKQTYACGCYWLTKK